jgi:cytochrome c oxidase cbb3-type subunit 3
MLTKKLVSLFLLGFFWGGGFSPSSPLASEKAASLYKDLCASCHGAKGRGDGTAAAALNPKPKDFTDCKVMAKDSDEILSKIIKEGSLSVGRSPMMPAWGGALNDQQVRDLVSYIRGLCKK